MAEVSKFAVPPAQTPRQGAMILTPFRYDLAVVAGDCPQNDNIAVFTPPAGAVIVGAQLRHDATLGAAATAKLRLGTTDLSAASTAGGASGVLQTIAHAPANGADKLNVLIEGAAIAASTTLRVVGFYLAQY